MVIQQSCALCSFSIPARITDCGTFIQIYTVAAHIVATYSGQSYTSFVEERIFAPLGMVSSTFSPTEAKASDSLTQGWSKKGRRVPEIFAEDPAFVMAGPAGVISNAIDTVGHCVPFSAYMDLSYFRSSGSRRGLMKVFTRIRLSSRCLYTGTRHILILFVPATRHIWKIRSSDMAWDGTVVRIAGTM